MQYSPNSWNHKNYYEYRFNQSTEFCFLLCYELSNNKYRNINFSWCMVIKQWTNPAPSTLCSWMKLHYIAAIIEGTLFATLYHFLEKFSKPHMKIFQLILFMKYRTITKKFTFNHVMLSQALYEMKKKWKLLLVDIFT